MTLVGSKKMVVYDDVSTDAKIQLYDKGITDLDAYFDSPDSFAEFQFQIRQGDVTIPRIRFEEPLRTECEHFVSCIRTGETPHTDGHNGLRVVKILEAAEKSLAQDGVAVTIRDAVETTSNTNSSI